MLWWYRLALSGRWRHRGRGPTKAVTCGLSSQHLSDVGFRTTPQIHTCCSGGMMHKLVASVLSLSCKRFPAYFKLALATTTTTYRHVFQGTGGIVFYKRNCQFLPAKFLKEITVELLRFRDAHGWTKSTSGWILAHPWWKTLIRWNSKSCECLNLLNRNCTC